MDAHALLTAQGWRGKGHSLHRSDDAVGLSKPLLLPRKADTRGLGQTQHFTSDQWWINAFDEQLQGLDAGPDGRLRQTCTAGKLNALERGALGRWYLYASFVRGGFLEGTVAPASAPAPADEPKPEAKAETKQERRARRAERRAAKEARAEARAARRASKAERAEARAERRARRAARTERAAARAARRTARAAASDAEQRRRDKDATRRKTRREQARGP